MCRRPLFSMQWPCGPSNSSDILQLNLHWPPWTTTCWPPPPPWSSPCLLVNDLIHHQIHDHLHHNCLIFKFENTLKEIKNLLWGGNCLGWKMSQKKEVAKVRLKSYNFQSSSSSSSMVGFCHWQIPTIIITDKIPPWWDFVMVGMCWVTMINPQILLPSAIFVDNIVMAMIKPSNIVAICYICWLQAPSIRTTKGASKHSNPLGANPSAGFDSW